MPIPVSIQCFALKHWWGVALFCQRYMLHHLMQGHRPLLGQGMGRRSGCPESSGRGKQATPGHPLASLPGPQARWPARAAGPAGWAERSGDHLAGAQLPQLRERSGRSVTGPAQPGR
ncbi:hypothetical protein SGLAU_33360 (plasmid) [Streptomyces glaucescens]|uniref:Uncharacterized protein n=1 Tax=Streptomyces glaucescens TaxID=1907 RepID=A0A089XMZ1_STRGA|nr:hypothetical protein SGLAU_32500 [Streptomyces glaucescens]AIS02600.1 hypothetical protein SGLAU_33360 [Streptomyces glaucescens]